MIYTGIKVRAPDVRLIVLRQLPVQLDSGIYVLNTVTETPYSTITLLAAYCHHSTTTPHGTIALTRGTMKVIQYRSQILSSFQFLINSKTLCISLHWHTASGNITQLRSPLLCDHSAGPVVGRLKYTIYSQRIRHKLRLDSFMTSQ
ncbi:hypothetical protein PoB_003898600 [Plakobranchus ocellatus]|uniref:Uncharacterized protein n=1 Tax=Plakobranchus ocellatus TaxID=259542 RepID=A0AAV4B0X3_9GAST|nr:hypothetical protein PoB_003898600 [Plakobranchus ocellatus]